MEIEQMVYETLLQASSQHPDMLKPAEQKLKEWEVEPGFYSVLFVRPTFFFFFIYYYFSFVCKYIISILIFREYFLINRWT